MPRDEIRMKLWCDAYMANMAGTGTQLPTDCANGAMAMFDRIFPDPEEYAGPEANYAVVEAKP